MRCLRHARGLASGRAMARENGRGAQESPKSRRRARAAGRGTYWQLIILSESQLFLKVNASPCEQLRKRRRGRDRGLPGGDPDQRSIKRPGAGDGRGREMKRTLSYRGGTLARSSPCMSRRERSVSAKEMCCLRISASNIAAGAAYLHTSHAGPLGARTDSRS